MVMTLLCLEPCKNLEVVSTFRICPKKETSPLSDTVIYITSIFTLFCPSCFKKIRAKIILDIPFKSIWWYVGLFSSSRNLSRSNADFSHSEIHSNEIIYSEDHATPALCFVSFALAKAWVVDDCQKQVIRLLSQATKWRGKGRLIQASEKRYKFKLLQL